ncbi:26S proteasome regulatory subunit 8 homolog B-like [Camellia sinensis]|uniref:26S proteasome regulatory subunit 8 homolog B-like n=1 Tax=Camellia sinensis TaxID=4442 RepID=UPI0010368441|nr:26S proteasome regulatory subunit 8 homolog B-like [Camellia sinensis]
MKESRHRRPLSESLASLSIAITSKRSSSESLASLSSRDQQTKQTELSPLPLTGALAPFLPTTQFQGVLLYGPPGTGKTLLVRAVAHHTDCTFIRVSGSELVQKYIREGSRMVRELFVMAREYAPSIIFMDEIDSIGSAQMESGFGNGDSEVQWTMLELLNQLDGFEASNKIKVLMATNRTDILDQALLRPGRIDRKIEFPNPNEEVDLLRSQKLDKVDVTLQPEELEVMNYVLHAKYEEARRRRSCVVSGRISNEKKRKRKMQENDGKSKKKDFKFYDVLLVL